jgi:hypothetical protein
VEEERKAAMRYLSKMRPLLLFFTFVFPARSADVTTVNLCELVNAPEKFNGQTVSVRASVDRYYNRIVLFGEDCDGMILLELRSRVEPQREFPLERDKQFEKFIQAVFDFKPGTMELRNRIKADFKGRFDWGSAMVGNRRIGRRYSDRPVISRLVLYKVSNVSFVPE